MKKLLLILVIFLGFIGSPYADFESWFNASNAWQKINNLEEDIQKETILKNLEALAQQGESSASLCLGRLYEDGGNNKIIARDANKSFSWYLKAAEQGNAFAPGIIGFMYQQGKGVIKEYSESSVTTDTQLEGNGLSNL